MKKQPTEWLEEKGDIARDDTDIPVSPNIQTEYEDIQYEPRDRTEPVKETYDSKRT